MTNLKGSQFKAVRNNITPSPDTNKNIFTGDDTRSSTSKLQNRITEQNKLETELKEKNANYSTVLAKLAKVKREFSKTLESDLDVIEDLAKNLEKLTKSSKPEDVKRKKQTFMSAVEQYHRFSSKFLEQLANGGTDEETWKAYQNLYVQIATQGGQNSEDAKRAVGDFKKVADKIKASGATGVIAVDVLSQSHTSLANQVDITSLEYDKLNKEAKKAAKQFEKNAEILKEAKQEIFDQAKELEKDGKSLKAAFLKMREFKKLGLGTRPGFLAEGVSGSKTADVLTGGASKGLSKYVGEEGKLNHAEIYKSLLSGIGDAAKQGFDAYRGTRQYGTLGQGGMSTFQAYQAHKAEMAGIELTTGADKGQANAVYGAAANQFQIGKSGWSSESARKNYLNEITKLTIQLGNATGVADAEVVELSASYQQMSGKDAMGALQETSEAITAALKRNNEVGKQFQLQSKDIASIWRALSSDLRLAGTDLKKFLDTAVGLNVVLGKQSVNMATIKRLQKEVIDLQSGSWGEEGGEDLASMFMMAGGPPKAGANAMAGIGGTKQFEGVHRYDLAGKMMEKAKGTPEEDFFVAFNAKSVGDTDYVKVLQALMGQKSEVFVGAQGAPYLSIARDILNLPNAEKVLDMSMADFDKRVMEAYKRMPESVSAVAIGSGKKEAARLLSIKGSAAAKAAPGLGPGGAPGATQEEIKGASATNAIVAGLADPMKTFSNAVDSFAGSVKVMAALTAIKGGLDVFQMLRGGGGGLPGGISGMGGGGAGASGLGSSLITAMGNGGANLFRTQASIATGGVVGLKGAMLSGATSVPLLGALGYGAYKGATEKAPETSDLDSGISGTESTRFIDKNAEKWVDTLEKGRRKTREAEGFWNTTGALAGEGARWGGYLASSVVATGADLAANLKDWMGFGPDKTPPQARNVPELTTKIQVQANGGTGVYDPNRGGIVISNDIVIPNSVNAQSNTAGNASFN